MGAFCVCSVEAHREEAGRAAQARRCGQQQRPEPHQGVHPRVMRNNKTAAPDVCAINLLPAELWRDCRFFVRPTAAKKLCDPAAKKTNKQNKETVNTAYLSCSLSISRLFVFFFSRRVCGCVNVCSSDAVWKSGEWSSFLSLSFFICFSLSSSTFHCDIFCSGTGQVLRLSNQVGRQLAWSFSSDWLLWREKHIGPVSQSRVLSVRLLRTSSVVQCAFSWCPASFECDDRKRHKKWERERDTRCLKLVAFFIAFASDSCSSRLVVEASEEPQELDVGKNGKTNKKTLN